MVAEMIEKAPTEAMRIIARLEGEFGMAGAAIADAIKVKPDTVRDIKRRKNTGNLQLYRLRRLISAMEPAGSAGEKTADAIAPTFPDIVPDFTPVTQGDDPASLTLSSDEPSATPQKPIKERAGDWLRAAMLGTPEAVASAPTKRKSGHGSKGETAEQGDLIEQLVPLAALLFVVTGSVMIPDPYKPCGPQTDEATAIVYPLVKRAVRELDARKKISDGTMDAIAVLVAMTAYGMRAHQTYQQIHAMEVERAASGNANGGVAGRAAAATVDASAGQRGPDASAPVTFRRAARADRQAPGGAGRGASGSGHPGDVRSGDALVDSLLAADAAGRYRLGL